MGNMIVSLPCIDTPEGGREVMIVNRQGKMKTRVDKTEKDTGNMYLASGDS